MLSIYCFFRNEAENLAKTVPSWARVADQLVLVDTGPSDDGSAEIAREAAEAENPRIQIVEACQRWRPRDRGGFGAIANIALCLCRGPWALKLDADEGFDCGSREDFRGLLQAVGDIRSPEIPRELWFSRIEPAGAAGAPLVVGQHPRCHYIAGDIDWRWKYCIDELPAQRAAEQGHVMLQVKLALAAIVHLRVTRPGDQRHDREFIARRELDRDDLTEADRRHYQMSLGHALGAKGAK